MIDVDRLKEAADVLPGCGHWKDAEYRQSWSLRLMDGDAEWRFVCEAIIEVAGGQRYCMDEGPRVEVQEIERWFDAARLLVAGQPDIKCEVHGLPRAGGIEEVCAIAYMSLYDPDEDGPCHMVEGVWVPTGKERD